MGGEINFGSRTEFLPGERLEESDIKYERYGGCFVSYKKGMLAGFCAILIAIVLAIAVYHYAPCRIRKQDEYDSAKAFISEWQTAQNQKEISKLTQGITPSFYRIKIQPYLNESDAKQFTFDGQISIVFQIDGPPITTLILNAKNLNISEADITVTYPPVSKIVPLQSASQTKTNDTESTATTEAILTTIESVFNATILTTEALLNTTLFETTTTVTTTEVANITEKPEIITKLQQPTVYVYSVPATDVEYIQVIRTKYNDDDETYKIRLKFALSKGTNYTINLKYSGKMTDGPGGVLRSNYRQGNVTKWLASTLFKPSYARLAFPCFDDPKFKTRVQLSIARQTKMKAVSNMRLNNTETIPESPGWVWDHFEVSPPMPTYLLAFAVFEFAERRTTSTVPLPLMKIWTRPDVRNETTYALNVAPKILSSYNAFFGYNYSLSKIELVLVPNYPINAMGNWGLLFFREDLLLVEDNSFDYQKVTTNEFLSTELARQWFENLIGIKSWSDLWFVEAMCYYARYIGINKAEPTWNILETLPVTDRQDVLDVDSLNILHKLTDSYTCYNSLNCVLNKKGSSILRLLNETLTEPQFTRGLQNFVDKRKYKTIEPKNLWSEWTTVANETIPKNITIQNIVDSWTNEEGYPLISITTENKSLSIKQSRYTEILPSESNNIWMLPIYYRRTKTNITKVWLVDGIPRVIDNASKTENGTWIVSNTRHTSLCRINYDLSNWKSLVMLLRSKPDTVSPSSRSQLLDDAFHLAQTGQLSNHVFLNLSLYLKDNEQHLTPWATALKYFEGLTEVLAKHALYGDFQDYILKLIEPIYKKLGITNKSGDSISTRKLRTKILSWACRFNYSPCINSSYSTFESMLSKPKNSKIIIRSNPQIVYCTGVTMMGRTAWEFLWNRYATYKTTQQENKALIIGLGCARETWLITKFLDNALKENSTQNAMLMWQHLSSNVAIDVAFKFLQDNWDTIYEKYSHLELITILKSVLSRLSTKKDLNQAVQLLSTRKSELMCYSSDIISIIEQIQNKLTWKDKFLTDFQKWVQMNVV